ncbi:MAG TPA: DUF3276 family protein [Bacteroidia bacterium]|nr:DUF3276 family protein [Bacteroidia bacterium]
MEENENRGRQEVYSKSVRAGKKRTYFFDVKTTRTNDYYLVITESKKRFGEDGAPMYEKHKIFLYREDFDKFIEALNETTAHITSIAPPLQPRESYAPPADETSPQPPTESENKPGFTDLNFEDLGGDEPKQ